MKLIIMEFIYKIIHKIKSKSGQKEYLNDNKKGYGKKCYYKNRKSWMEPFKK